MSDLNYTEKLQLEKLLGMSSGYVLDFSNRTFEEFVAESVGVNIFDEKYSQGSGSKANRLRAFWTHEPNYLVGRLIHDLLEYARRQTTPPVDSLLSDCYRIAERLRRGAPVVKMPGGGAKVGEQDFRVLLKSLGQAIDRNQPEAALDRLHTYVVKYMRHLCQCHGLEAGRDRPLHSLVAEYTKHLKAAGLIESEMTERILKSSISIMEAFNRVRNEQSLAHDNPVLNYDESLLIFNHVVGAVQFVESIERKLAARARRAKAAASSDDVPF
jgi:Abortive infection C-terminus